MLLNVMKTYHRWCLWYILTKFRKKLGAYKLYEEFKVVLHETIYGSVFEEELEHDYCAGIAKHDIQDDKWLDGNVVYLIYEPTYKN